MSFVLGSDAAFVAFGKAFELLAGPADDDGAWYFAPGDARLSGLDLGRVPELAPRESRPNRGFRGRVEPIRVDAAAAASSADRESAGPIASTSGRGDAAARRDRPRTERAQDRPRYAGDFWRPSEAGWR